MSKPRCRSCGASGHDVKSDDTTSKDGKAWVIHQCWMCGNQWITDPTTATDYTLSEAARMYAD